MSANSESLVQLLDECIQMLVDGESVAACLARYPDHATALEPLLSSVVTLRKLASVPARLPEIAARGRADFISALDGIAAFPTSTALSTPASSPGRAAYNVGGAPGGFFGRATRPLLVWRMRLSAWWHDLSRAFGSLQPLPRGLAASIAAVLLVGMVLTGVAGVSATALPGDTLYGVKLAGEQARLFFALDPAAHRDLNQQFENERRHETAEVMRLHRTVATLSLAGRLESFTADQWWVGGLTVHIDDQTRIVGTPVAGASVHGLARAPGDGTLVGIRLVVEAPPAALISPAPTADLPLAAAATAPIPPIPTATASPSPTPREALAGAWSEPREIFPTRERRQPPAPSPSPVFVKPTPLSTPTVTPVATPSLTPSPVWQPQPRSDPKVRLAGAFVQTVAGSRWTIGGVTFDVDGSTRINGNPGVGDKVDVVLLVRADGSYLALEITLVAIKAEPFELTGVLSAKGAAWVIDGISVSVGADTAITGAPGIGDVVHCAGLRDANGYHAARIEKLLTNVVEFSGVVEAVSADSWVVGGHTVSRSVTTQVIGNMAVGRIADVRAEQMPDGRLVAVLIFVRPDTPTPTATLTPSPTQTLPPTNTATPTATNTLVPAATSTSTATATASNTPTAANTPTPTPSGTPLASGPIAPAS